MSGPDRRARSPRRLAPGTEARGRSGSENDAVVGYFDRSVERWDTHYERGDRLGHWLRGRLALALALLGDGAGDVLDAGMGSGRLVV